MKLTDIKSLRGYTSNNDGESLPISKVFLPPLPTTTHIWPSLICIQIPAVAKMFGSTTVTCAYHHGVGKRGYLIFLRLRSNASPLSIKILLWTHLSKILMEFIQAKWFFFSHLKVFKKIYWRVFLKVESQNKGGGLWSRWCKKEKLWYRNLKDTNYSLSQIAEDVSGRR